jgi:SanA protein
MGTTPGKIRRKWLLAAAVVAAAGTGAAVCLNAWVLVSTRARISRRVDDVPPRTVAIVPGARVYRGGVPSAALEDRLEAALDLYRAGRVGKVIVSGDHNTPEYDEVNAMQRWMREHGVPDRDCFLDHAGLRTRDTMQRAARVFQVRDAVVCTQAFHLPRSVFLAREAGIDAVGLEADRRVYRSVVRDQVREVVSRTVAGLEALVFKTEPRFLGPPIPIDGDATATHDAWTGP